MEALADMHTWLVAVLVAIILRACWQVREEFLLVIRLSRWCTVFSSTSTNLAIVITYHNIFYRFHL